MTEFSIRLCQNLAGIDRNDWNNLAGDNPFISHEYLSSLEESHCLEPETGWQANHIILENNGKLDGAIPLYVKYNSQGEYVFDYAWADFFSRCGQEYYPKLLCASPFTPVGGPRILAKTPMKREILLQTAIGLCQRNDLSSFHVNFPNENELEDLAAHGFLKRVDLQYWFENENYRDFDDYLSQLSSSRRKNIKRERRLATENIDIKTFVGNEINESHLDALYEFICDTYSRKWGLGTPYQTRKFFSLILQKMPQNLVLFLAFENETPIAGAINFRNGQALYGRQWGCIKEIPFLHFELCYYKAIEFAIDNKIKRVEAGTQGEHKLSRGYLPQKVYSAHFITRPEFREPISQFLSDEAAQIEILMHQMREKYSPFKQI